MPLPGLSHAEDPPAGRRFAGELLVVKSRLKRTPTSRAYQAAYPRVGLQPNRLTADGAVHQCPRGIAGDACQRRSASPPLVRINTPPVQAQWPSMELFTAPINAGRAAHLRRQPSSPCPAPLRWALPIAVLQAQQARAPSSRCKPDQVTAGVSTATISRAADILTDSRGAVTDGENWRFADSTYS